MNLKKVYRLYTEEGLAVRTKKRRKRPSHLRLVLPPAEAPNERWSMDLVTDRMEHGRYFRVLTVVDYGSEFFSKAMGSWAYRRGVQLEFIRPGRAVENAFEDSLHAIYRPLAESSRVSNAR